MTGLYSHQTICGEKKEDENSFFLQRNSKLDEAMRMQKRMR
jgi:hypothetical protein